MNNNEVSNRRVLFGVFLILGGGIWILIKMQIIPPVVSDILISWQMLLIGIGIFSFVAGNRTAGTILIIVGSFFLIDELNFIPDFFRQIGWPLLIIGIGIALLLTHKSKSQPLIPEPSKIGMDYFDDFIIFGGKEIFISSKNFLGGKVTSIFAGAEYDLRHANLSDNGAVIDAVCIFGGSGFKVPPEWNIKNEVTTIFGAFTDKRGSTGQEMNFDPSKTLIIKGFSTFGGVEVKYN
ncbi:MAG: DUF5668 domain-containing protein [Mariniphaga sp.]